MSNIYTDIFEAMDRIRDASGRWSSDHDLLAETKDLLARCSAKMQEMQQRSSSAEMELRSLLAAAQARAERAEGERGWLLEELVKESATLAHESATNSKSFEQCLNDARFLIEKHLKNLHTKLKTDPCHKCLIEHQGDDEVLKCLKPATHMWTPVEGADVPLCEMHASRLSRLPSIAETIKPIDHPAPQGRTDGESGGQICGLCDKRKPCKCLMELESDATAPEVKGGAA
jgi:hypothetical protein